MAHSTARKVSHQFPTLDRAVEVSQVVRGLRAYGLTQAEIGTATGAKVRAVRNWERTSATDVGPRIGCRIFATSCSPFSGP